MAQTYTVYSTPLCRCRTYIYIYIYIGVGTGGALGERAPQVFAKVNAHYTRVVEERPLYKGVVVVAV